MTTNDLGASGVGGALSDTDLATIDVLPVNDAPDGTDTTVTTPEDTARVITIGTFGFTDVDSGDAMTDVRIDSVALPAGATLQLSGVDVVAGQVIAVADIGANSSSSRRSRMRTAPATRASRSACGTRACPRARSSTRCRTR